MAASVAQFVIAGLAVTVALVASSGMLARRAGVAEATGSFEDLARVAAAELSPSLDARPDADPQTRATLSRQLTALRDAGPAVRVEVLAPTGEVLWSSLPRLEGETFALQPRQQQALWAGSAGSQVSAASPDGNGFPPGQGPLLQAFVGVRDVHGSPLLVTFYESYAVVTAHAQQLWWRFVPAFLVALVVLEVVQVPLGWSLAHRLRRSQEAEEVLVQAAADAAHAERRRIAGEVHDHVVQDLTGLALDLDVARLRREARSTRDEQLLSRTAAGLRAAVAELRALLVSLIPTRLPDGDLGAALQALAASRPPSSARVVVETGDIEELPEAVATLLYRCAQEALRNVDTHSRATTVELSIRCDEGNAIMVVDDDGSGFDEGRLARRQATGHLGLRALGELLADAGGSLVASSAQGQGTRLVATVPLAAARVLTRTPR